MKNVLRSKDNRAMRDEVARSRGGVNPLDFSVEFGISLSAAYATAKRVGVPVLNRSRDSLEEIKKSYVPGSKESTEELATRLGTTVERLRRRAQWHRISRRERLQTQVLESGINTESEAYFVGFTLADGCIEDHLCQNRPDQPLSISWGIQARDVEVLEWIKGFLGTKRPIMDKVVKLRSTGKSYKASVLVVSESGLCGRLARFGVVPRKSLKEVYPVVGDVGLWGAFLRGFLDGDGCISISSKGVEAGRYIGFYGGNEFLQSLKKDLINRLGISDNSISPCRRGRKLQQVHWSAKGDVLKLLQLMYPEGYSTTPALCRKKERAMLLKEFYTKLVN